MATARKAIEQAWDEAGGLFPFPHTLEALCSQGWSLYDEARALEAHNRELHAQGRTSEISAAAIWDLTRRVRQIAGLLDSQDWAAHKALDYSSDVPDVFYPSSWACFGITWAPDWA